MTPQRTKDTYEKRVYDFIKDILVVCPSCSRQAVVKTLALAVRNINEHEIKVTCTHCGFNKRLEEKPGAILFSTSTTTIPGRYLIIGGSIDPYFHLPLWLTINCCDNTIWAYNYEHLEFLKAHVEAKLRERNTQEWSNKSLGSRLPKWMTSSKNRETVLKAIAQLKAKGLST
jgi:Zn ribbon nucleic-acid-binding protein